MQTIQEYLQNITPPQRAEFERVRNIVKEVVPEADEKISYGIPTFTYKGKYLIYFGAFTNHMSLFPASDQMIKDIPELAKFRASKGTLQFTENNLIPDTLIRKMVEYLLAGSPKNKD